MTNAKLAAAIEAARAWTTTPKTLQIRPEVHQQKERKTEAPEGPEIEGASTCP